MNATKTRRNWTYLTVAAIVRIYMIGALAISFSHIITASHMLELNGWQAYTVPFAIDGFAVLGMIGRSHRFAEATRRTGFRFQLGAGALSFAANVFAGHTVGERLYGALIVAAFVAAEKYADKLRPAPVVTEEAKAKRSEAAKRGAVTRKANAAKAKRRPRKPAHAPVSPGMAPVTAPTAEALDALIA